MRVDERTVDYVGDPFVDAGVAALETRLERPCKDFTEADLVSQAAELKREYSKRIWKGYLTVHFPNSGWCNATIGADARARFLDVVLAGYCQSPLMPRRGCSYCGRPAQILADRSHVPLLSGEKNMATCPGGSPGLPVCGFCLFAIQFYPLCTLKVAGRPLFWWAPDPRWTYLLNQRFIEAVQRIAAADVERFTNLRWPSTQLLKCADEVAQDWSAQDSRERPPLCDVVGCHATNFGSEPQYEELRIPRGVLEFWANANSFGRAYRSVVDAAWEVRRASKTESKPIPPGVQREEEIQPPLELPSRKNIFYEALGEAFRSPDFADRAKRVAVSFFFRAPASADGIRTFELTSYFLQKVANMDKARLDAIREIADLMAESASADDMLSRFMRSAGLRELMPAFRYAQHKLTKEGRSIPWEKILLALGLVDEDDATRSDAWLVGELMLIRLLEKLGHGPPDLANGSAASESPGA